MKYWLQEKSERGGLGLGPYRVFVFVSTRIHSNLT